ncbi:DUF1376 domain-containing protein [Methylobacterium cerastii]|uniref:DUF1376 domain-containing protein n=1 Tax=Methylobacterium cerastii TaxID=932741 RepID=UPI001EE1B8AC|nr:DUF1376 domain-containing protein [Methylobacterium cerastii]
MDRYLADTAHLTLEQQAVHFRLQIYAWRSPGCRLPDDDAKLARMLGITGKRWASLKPAVTALWTLSEGLWANEQVTREHEFVEGKIEKRRSAGKLGGRPKSLPDNDPGKAKGSENEKQTESKTKAATATATIPPKAPKGADPDGFAEFWQAYPKRDGDNPRKTAVRAYAKAVRDGAEPAAILRAVRAYAAELRTKGRIGSEFVAQATTWLNQGRFERFTQGPEAQEGGEGPDQRARLAKVPDSEWRNRLSVWKSRGGHWPYQHLTEPPDDPRTKVPDHVLAEFDIQHLTERPTLALMTRTG